MPSAIAVSNYNKGLNQSYTLKHRELVIPNLAASVAGTSYLYQVNVDNQNIFPWLSGISPSFEKYTIHKMEL